MSEKRGKGPLVCVTNNSFTRFNTQACIFTLKVVILALLAQMGFNSCEEVTDIKSLRISSINVI